MRASMAFFISHYLLPAAYPPPYGQYHAFALLNGLYDDTFRLKALT